MNTIHHHGAAAPDTKLALELIAGNDGQYIMQLVEGDPKKVDAA